MNPSITTLDKSNSLPLILLNASLYDTQLLVAKVPQQNSLDGTQTGMLVEELVEVLVDVDVLVVVLVEELVVVPPSLQRFNLSLMKIDNASMQAMSIRCKIFTSLHIN